MRLNENMMRGIWQRDTDCTVDVAEGIADQQQIRLKEKRETTTASPILLMMAPDQDEKC
jgi:hypothetical protein